MYGCVIIVLVYESDFKNAIMCVIMSTVLAIIARVPIWLYSEVVVSICCELFIFKIGLRFESHCYALFL